MDTTLLTSTSPTLQSLSVESSTDDARLVQEGEAAVDAYVIDLDHARSRVLVMARGLCAARRLYPATREFGAWLETSPYKQIGQTDRAALIHIGEHEALAGRFLLTTPRVAPRAVWGAIKPWASSPSSSSISPVGRSSNHPPSAPGPATTTVAESSAGLSGTLPPVPLPSTPNAPASPSTNNSRMTARCKFAEAPRAEEIYEIFQHKEARATLARIWTGKRGKEIWDLLVTAFEAGLLVPNNRAFSTASMWLLFPSTSAVKAYNDSLQDLQAPGAGLSYLKKTLLPLMADCRDKLMADPDRPVEILREVYENRKRLFFARSEKPSSPVIEETPLLSHAPSVDDPRVSMDQLVEEIESRIKKLAHLCGPLDTASKQHLVDRLNRSLAKITS